jgi:glutathione peroxidase
MTWMIASAVLAVALSTAVADTAPTTRPAGSVLEATAQDAAGQPVKLEQYRGNVLLIVNVASKCGFTPQYAQLEQVYQKYKDRGLIILGFPANDFGHQEPGTNEQIQQFCQANYGVTFPVFAKLVAKGEGQSPLYQYLTSKQTNGEFAGAIGWNFTKFLVSREGKVVARYDSATKPDDAKVTSAIEAELAKGK